MLQRGFTHFDNLVSIPNFPIPFSHKPIFSSKPQQWPSWITHEYKTRRNLKICAFSTKRSRSGRKVKSNEELCTDIREFVAAVGLPEGHVPSLKELSQHGRNDLANILKRRGYKPIKQLLSSSPKTDSNGFVKEKRVVQKHDATCDSDDTFKGQYEKSERAIEYVSLPTEDQNEMEGAMLEDVSASTFFQVDENYSRSLNVNLGHNSDNRILMPEEPTAMSSLEEKVANFVQNGDLDAIEYDFYKILNESGEKESKEVVGTNNEVATQSIKRSEERSGHAYDAPITLNGSATVAKQVAPPVAMDYLPWREAQTLKGNDLMEDLDSETIGRDNLIEINHLKFMLHQKEFELSHLKERIEKEKMALSSLQTKAEIEIQKAQKLVSEKDAELQAAQESLSGLQEVQLEYSGDGEIVEVSGSFNGWNHWIKMDHKPSSTIENPIESSKSKIWSTVLWLYPGVYEIKFIVDGEWKLDPKRETTSNGRICNNILQVDR